MKQFLGVLASLLVVGGAVLGILALWGIYPLSTAMIWKLLLSLLIASVTITLLVIAGGAFFKKEKYDDRSSGNAHPMKK